MGMTINEIQGHLVQMLTEGGYSKLSKDRRYALKASIDALELMKRLAPGLQEARKQMDDARANSNADSDTPPPDSK